MKLSFLLALVAAACMASFAQEAMPRMTSVEPMSGKVGDVVAITGENLDKDNVLKVFLTDDKNDLVCEIVEQSAAAIKVKIPAKATGRMAFMIRTGGKEPKDIVQPVKVTIE
ncbi:MAG TPA: IPT/TIG domain-containing protein [Verrucomicrobiae bacterium]|nr:IPT/TIG domain-containing protein [Verrucomicrobiae bacterium]